VQGARDKREALLIAIGVFALAFAVRAVFAFQWQTTPYGGAPLLDARAYDDWAQAIAQGHWLRARAFYQSPLYPYLLAALYKIFGHNYLAASFLNAALDAGTAAILSLISFTLFGRMAAIVTGLLAAFYAPMIFYTAPVMKEPLGLFLLALFLLFALRAVRAGWNRDFAWAGFFLGLAALTRGNVLLLAPVLPVAAFIRQRHAAKTPAFLFVAALCVAIAPAAVHNYIASHDFVPVTYSGGFNLYIGHSPYANGTNAYPPEVSTDPVQEELNASYIASQEVGHTLKPSQVSDYWRGKAVAFAVRHPVREIQLLGLKLYASLNGADGFDNYDSVFIRKNFPTILNYPLAGFPLVIALAAFAFVAGWRLYRREMIFLIACVGVYMLSVVAFYVTDRYRLPVVIFLLPLAGEAWPQAVQLWRARDIKHMALTGGVAAAFLALALAPPLNAVDLTAFDYGTLVAVYADKGDAAQALTAFDKGVAASAQDIGAQAYVRAAEMHEKEGDAKAAAALIWKAVELFPEDGIALYNLGRLEALQGNLPAALMSLQAAERLAPTYGLIYYALARIYERMKDEPAARKAIEDGLAINPEDERLRGMREGR
jgi:4-amino-4-deoxy-L-arabinose transferase-like glycosyltransferase